MFFWALCIWALDTSSVRCWCPLKRGKIRHWFRLVKESALRPLITAAETIQKNLRGIMIAMTTGTSNAKAEAINKTIKNLARISHGYRNKERYKNMIYLRLGKLDLRLDH
ncbi:transposase [Thalassolituus oleivorans]|uniref:transposase n=1 Tax=Thalassolituus oleivorans TaxID=187493 RepID=UPI003C6FD468